MGIGISSPQSKLHSYTSGTGSIPTGQFNQTSDDNTALTLINANNSATYSAIKLETRETQAAGWMIANEFQSAFNGDLVFRGRNGGTSSAEVLRLKSSSGTLILSGNGGSTTNSLDIAYNGTSGQASINADSNGGSTFLTFGTSLSGSLNEAMRIRSNGEVDIKLGTNAYGTFSQNIGEVGAGTFCLQIANSDFSALKPLGFRAEEIKFATGSATRMTIDGSGNATFSGQVFTNVIGRSDDTNTTIDFPGSDVIQMYTAGVERLRIDQYGTLAVGTTDTHQWTVFDGRIRVGATACFASTSNSVQMLSNAYYNNNYRYIANDEASRYYQSSGGHHWDTAASGSADGVISFSEAMRITSGGILAVGDGTPENGAYATTKRLYLEGAESVQMIKNLSASDSANRVAIGFLNSSGTAIGNISNNSSATNYTTSSDYRLKENVTYDWDALTRLKQLKPARFNWIIDDTNTLVDGFLAHEAQEVVPEAVTGEHNETKDLTNVVLNEFGNVIATEVTEDEWKSGKEAQNPVYAANTTWKAEHTQDVYQGIDQSKLVPLLVKAMQEQQTLIETLTDRIAALENS